jgi:HAD superfamily hydrolase (TIGR01509 family)
MIRALVFDFDGLILDTESAQIAAYADVYAAHGMPFDLQLFQHSVGHGELAFDPWRAFGPDADRIALEGERRDRNHQRDRELAILPGVPALLAGAREQGLRVGLCSNSPRAHCVRHLTRHNLLWHFEFLACRGEAPLPKPAPDLYQLVLGQFGLRGFQAIAFEDSYTGSLAAKRANLWCVVAPGPSTAHHDFSHADRLVTSLADCTLADLMAEFRP